MSPKARGRSLDLIHIWYSTPTAGPETALVTQMSRMVWKAMTDREEARQRGTTIADLRRTWQAAHRSFQPLVEAWKAARGEDGTVPRKVARARWGKTQGPMAAAALSLARVGWDFSGPFEITDERGATTVLTKTSPAMVRDLMRDATRRMLERRASVRLAKHETAFGGRSACADLAIAASRPGKRIAAMQVGASNRLPWVPL